MATSLDSAAMRALADKHGACEVAHDWDGALATMGDAPFYEFYPFRLRISGADAIKNLWRGVFTKTDGRIIRCFDEPFLVPDSHEYAEYINEDSLVEIRTWTFVGDDGEHHSSKSVVIYAFEGDRMRSETMFVDESTKLYMDRVFDAEFRAQPGVEEI
jgi:hypothetical protein